MTRETKIGLLVGLAFIIVIGILLSDHLTNSTEPPPAPMSQAGPSVRSAITTPTRQQQPIAEAVPPQVQPNQPVPTANDLVPRPQPVRIVQVETPGNYEPVTIASPQNESTQPPPQPVTYKSEVTVPEQPVREVPMSRQPASARVTPPPQQSSQQTARIDDPMLNRLNQEAAKVGEAIVPVGQPQASATFTATRYKAESGDTLSKIAMKMYGSSTKALRDAIVEANPSLRDNPNLVIEGRTYAIPSMGKPIVGGQDQNVTTVSNSIKLPQDSAATDPNAVYVVKEGDNLTRIAIDQCGGETALAALKELNRDQLNGGDLIRPGMKLRLPAKSVAINN